MRNDEITMDEVKAKSFSHIVISPGPGSPDDRSYFGVCREVIINAGKSIPLLGICLGHQGIVSAFGGKVVRAKVVKHGKTSVITHNGKGIFANLQNPLIGMRYHSLVGERSMIPDELEITAISLDDGEVMGVRHRMYPVFGVQFHPESVGTSEGKKIISNFLNMIYTD